MSVIVDGKALYQAAAFEADGLAGATAVGRFAGATTSGAPGSGSWDTGDLVVDQSGALQVCTAGGSPGTWSKVSGGGSGALTAPASVSGAITSGQTGFNVNISNSGAITAETFLDQIQGTTLTITGGYTTQRFALVNAPTISAASSQTVTNAATLAIGGAPVAAGSAVITNPYALWVQGGNTRLDGNLTVGNVIDVTSVSTNLYLGTSNNAFLVHLLHQSGGANDVVTITEINQQGPGTIAVHINPGYATSGNPVTGVTSETPGLQSEGTRLQLGASGYATQRSALFTLPSVTAGSSLTVTTYATLAIAGAPAALGSAIITNAYALWVQAGVARFEGAVQMGSSLAVVSAVTLNSAPAFNFNFAPTAAGTGGAPTLPANTPTGATGGAGKWVQVQLQGTTAYLLVWE